MSAYMILQISDAVNAIAAFVYVCVCAGNYSYSDF